MSGVSPVQAEGELLQGRVVEHRGKSLTVTDESGNRIRCHIRTRLGQAAVGDRVLWLAIDDQQGRVEKILPRTTLLSRPSRQGQTRPVAANLDQVAVLVSSKPECDLLLLDQFLVITEHIPLPVLIVLNKCDLPGTEQVRSQLDVYSELGYDTLEISAKFDQGMAALEQNLKAHCSILVGQSGVGKSTLTNRLLPEAGLVTRAVSQATGHGRHTTTATTLYELPYGGELIDSPGVNIFGLANIDAVRLAQGYREIHAAAPHCRFHNCMHLAEPGCEVRRRLDTGAVSEERYGRYLKLREKLSVG